MCTESAAASVYMESAERLSTQVPHRLESEEKPSAFLLIQPSDQTPTSVHLLGRIPSLSQMQTQYYAQASNNWLI